MTRLTIIPISRKNLTLTLHEHSGVSTSLPQRNNKVTTTEETKLNQKIHWYYKMCN
jgi:hypothetical protein